MALDFLLEIGSEEIPDWMIEPALDHLKGAFTKLLAESKLKGAVVWADATPRRLVVQLSGLSKGQKDSVETVSGPPKSAGEGAAMGFARKMGVTPDQLETVKTDKGEYFCFKRKLTGKSTGEILAAALPQLILGIPWPKNMFWLGKGTPRFIRPIRWIVALLGPKVVEFEITGVKSGNTTLGHRRLLPTTRRSSARQGAARPIKVSTKNYEQKLLENFVVVRADARRRKIEAGIADLLAGTELAVKPDAALANTLCYITEYPTPILGSFAESYLSLPAEVLVTVMRHHQKYFSVLRADGSLAPNFIAVMNTDGDPEGFVRNGNERVLRARFNDARFFYDVDQKKPLTARVDELRAVTYHKDIGSYSAYVSKVAVCLNELSAPMAAHEACLIFKCDLTTEMVKEFTDLQGIVGGIYARHQGHREEVSRAVYEHYQPISMADPIPGSTPGQYLAIADKLTTLREFFAIGLVPSGSRDPFALRRAAQGLVKIISEGRLPITVTSLWRSDQKLKEFVLDRVRHYFKNVRGYSHDEVSAVLHGNCFYNGVDFLHQVENTLADVHSMRGSHDFEKLCTHFGRIRGILQKERGVYPPHGAASAGIPFDENLLVHDEERLLWGNFLRVSSSVSNSPNVKSSIAEISTLGIYIDNLFEKVLVNDPNEAIRRNRLFMLRLILDGFLSIADFSEIITSSNQATTTKEQT